MSMNTLLKTVFLVLSISALQILALSDSGRISELEKRVESLEGTLSGLEPLFVARYGLIKNCETPPAQKGETKCEDKLKPGAKCWIVCDTGYIATPGKEVTHCKEGGYWSVDLQCEIPLVLVSGGTVDQSSNGDSSMELLSLYPSSGCERNFADMPSRRSLHNLVYLSPEKVLACNGMMTKNVATCDALDMKTNKWSQHSHPNKAGGSFIDSGCDKGGFSSSLCRDSPERKKGRYAAESLHVAGQTLIMGGMVYDDNGHDVTSSVRYLAAFFPTHWKNKRRMRSKRAFFCTVKVKDGGILVIGGLGHNNSVNTVEKSVEFKSMGNLGYLKSYPNFSDMHSPRSGHSCSAIPGDDQGNDFHVLVSGGTKGFGQTAMTDAEIFDWNTNSWRSSSVGKMKTGRFGHAVVAVGEKIFAIGGDDRDPNNVLDTIEEYDVKRNTWSIIQTMLKMPRSNFGFTLVPHSMFDGCQLTTSLSHAWPEEGKGV